MPVGWPATRAAARQLTAVARPCKLRFHRLDHACPFVCERRSPSEQAISGADPASGHQAHMLLRDAGGSDDGSATLSCWELRRRHALAQCCLVVGTQSAPCEYPEYPMCEPELQRPPRHAPRPVLLCFSPVLRRLRRYRPFGDWCLCAWGCMAHVLHAVEERLRKAQLEVARLDVAALPCSHTHPREL